MQQVVHMPETTVDLIRAGEAARLLEISTQHLQRLALSGAVPYTLIGGWKLYERAVIVQMAHERKTYQRGKRRSSAR